MVSTHDQPEVDCAEFLERKSNSVIVAATFMDHVKTITVASWRDRRDSEWQTAIYRWRAMLSTWDRKVQITEQVFAVKVSIASPSVGGCFSQQSSFYDHEMLSEHVKNDKLLQRPWQSFPL